VDEGRFCAMNWLDEEMAFVQPKVIVALGSVALKYLMGPNADHEGQGRWFETKYGVPAIATYHPAYLLR
jgi:DNA polymerase